jgi:hypothetical protein
VSSDHQRARVRFEAEHTRRTLVGTGDYDLGQHERALRDRSTERLAERHTDIGWSTAISGSYDLSSNPLRIRDIRTATIRADGSWDTPTGNPGAKELVLGRRLVSTHTVKLFWAVCCHHNQWHTRMKGLEDCWEIVSRSGSRRRNTHSWPLALKS